MRVTIPRELPIKSINTSLKPDTNGNVNITKSTVGLNNVDNTSDANKPVSTATQTALDLKAPLASPALTGTPTAPTATSGTSSTQIATTEFVMNAFRANDAMIYKGTIGSSGATITALPATHYQGWTYKVITAGTYAGVKCEIGDMIICITDGISDTDSHWSVIQSNIDGAIIGPASSTENHIVTFNGSTGKVVKDSGFTIAKSVPSDAVFTDTHYNTHLYAGTGSNSNATTTNGNTKLTIADNSTVTDSITIKGNNAITVVSDSNGTVTIGASAMIGATSQDAGTAGLVPSPTSGNTRQVLMSNGTWEDLTGSDVAVSTSNSTKIDSALNSLNQNFGILSSLTTREKSNLVGAVNEIDLKVSSILDERPVVIARMMAQLFDGTATTYRQSMKNFFDYFSADSLSSAELTELCSAWYEGTRDTWNGYTTFYKPTVSAVSTGTKGGDNANLVCEPSTDLIAGRDDYAGLSLFAPTDVNYIIDAETLEPLITGIKGITSSFEKNNPDKLVGVMQMSGYLYTDEDTNTFNIGYSAQPLTEHDFCEPVPEAVKIDGTVRQFVIHTKYMGKVVNSKMRAYSGVIPTAWQSHNTLQTNCKANGTQYGGGSVLLQSWLILMTRIKYANLTQDGNIQGCMNYNYQYYATASETGVKRILLTPAQAANLIVGSGVLVGEVAENNGVDRGIAACYNITGQKGAVITAIEEVEIDNVTYSAIYVSTDNTFNTVGDGTKTTGNTMISTFHWPTGTNDNILGNDGSKASPGNGVYPATLQGIEYSVGAWEVFGDVIIRMLPADNDHEFGMTKYALVDRAANQTTSVTENYRDSGVELPKPASAAGWSYIKHQSAPKGVFLADDCSSGGSSSVLMRDGFCFGGVVTSETLRGFLAFGSLHRGEAIGGLSAVRSDVGLSYASWGIAGRPSACGNRGAWAS